MNRNDTIKGILFGAVGGAVGTFCMSYYWKGAEALHGHDPRMLENEGPPQTMDEIAPGGLKAEEDEASTEVVGRLLHETATGHRPSADRKTKLSEGVHWSYGTIVSSLYGAIRGPRAMPDATGGLVFGTALWAVGDEIMVPLLGLSKGPTAYPMEQHAHRWGAHLFYGVIAAATTQGLFRIFSPRRTRTEIVMDAMKTYVTWKAMKSAMGAIGDAGKSAAGMVAKRKTSRMQHMLDGTKKLARSATNGAPRAVAREAARSGRTAVRAVSGMFS